MNKKILLSVIGFFVIIGIGFGTYYVYNNIGSIFGKSVSLEGDINLSFKEGSSGVITSSIKGLKFGVDMDNSQAYFGFDKLTSSTGEILDKTEIILDKENYYFLGDKLTGKQNLDLGNDSKYQEIFNSIKNTASGDYLKFNLVKEFLDDLGEFGEDDLVKIFVTGEYLINSSGYFKDREFFKKLKNRFLVKGSYSKLFNVVREEEGKKYLEFNPKSCDYIKIILTSDITLYPLSDSIIEQCKTSLPMINTMVSPMLYLTQEGDYDKLNFSNYGFIKYGNSEIKEFEFSTAGQELIYKEKNLEINTIFLKGKVDFTDKIVKGDLRLNFSIPTTKDYVKGSLVFEGSDKIEWDLDFALTITNGSIFKINGSGNNKSGDLKLTLDSDLYKLDYLNDDKKELNLNMLNSSNVGDIKLSLIGEKLNFNINTQSKSKDEKINGNFDFVIKENTPLIKEINGKISITKKDLDPIDIFILKFNTNYTPGYNDVNIMFKLDENGNSEIENSDIEVKIDGKIKFGKFNMVNIPTNFKEIKILELMK